MDFVRPTAIPRRAAIAARRGETSEGYLCTSLYKVSLDIGLRGGRPGIFKQLAFEPGVAGRGIAGQSGREGTFIGNPHQQDPNRIRHRKAHVIERVRRAISDGRVDVRLDNGGGRTSIRHPQGVKAQCDRMTVSSEFIQPVSLMI